MASNLSPAFAYTVVYVKDVAKSVAFYAKAFGYNVRRVDESHRYNSISNSASTNILLCFARFCFFLSIISILRWGELESGQTTIAFTPAHQHETDLTGSVQTFKSGGVRQPVELCFDYPDVDAAYKVYVLDLDVVSRLN